MGLSELCGAPHKRVKFRNAWIDCASIESNPHDQHTFWRKTIPASYGPVSTIRRP